MALGFALGCAQIFGIDEACEVGTPGCGAVPTCEAYCQAITDNAQCNAPAQYQSEDQCMTFCPFFPTESAATEGVDNLACRFAVAIRPPAPGSNDCVRAGPTGGDSCGGPCETYCDLMDRICRGYFEGFDTLIEGRDADRRACAALCMSLSGTSDTTFDSGPDGQNDLGEPSAQCRIWHLVVAAESPADSPTRRLHCDHAVGYPVGMHCKSVPGDPAQLSR